MANEDTFCNVPHHHIKEQHLKSANRLVLCFDGTGNEFLGTPSDTNIVKIYEMLDRSAKDQFHYYQPGIGTYSNDDLSNSSSRGIWGRFKAKLRAAMDEGVGLSFGIHVIAGYKFLMKYYNEGDAIYIFGFSRGAYTARFLAEMVNTIGLLSRGNEEMVHFAWKAFSDYQGSRGNDPPRPQDIEKKAYMNDFKHTFCREDVKIHFLGLFDCVNSVGQFDVPFGSKSYKYIAAAPAEHIRHAVSIHERRLKFKPALFNAWEIDKDADIVEMWFAGNHADIGGGWGMEPHQKALLSDTPLKWMVDEVRNLPDNPNPLKFHEHRVKSRAEREIDNYRALSLCDPKNFQGNKKSPAEYRRILSRPHDMLAMGRGTPFFGVLSWWVLEVLPFFERLELELEKWVPRHWPPNMGANRDIPLKANIHESVKQLHKAGVLTDKEMPVLGGDGPPRPLLPSLQATTNAWGKLREARKAGNANGGSSSGGGGENGYAGNPYKWAEAITGSAKQWL